MASCLTVAALPFLLREGKEQRTDRPPTVAAVAPGAEALAAPTDGEAADTPAPTTPAVAPPTTDAGPSFLSGGPTTPTVVRTITVAVPTTHSDTTEVGRASYRRWPAGATVSAPCAAWFLPVGTRVTVTNLDNGHAVTCVIADRIGVPDDQVIVLDTPMFEQLADLVEAPIPVSITWR